MSDEPKEVLHFCEKTNKTENICNAQWISLYTTCAYVDETPTPDQQELVSTYFRHFSDQCRDPAMGGRSLDKALKQNPLTKTTTRRELMMWACTLENFCREENGIPLRQCRYNKLMERWRYADGYL